MNYLRYGFISLIIVVCLLFAAGCTSTSSAPSAASTAAATPGASQPGILVYAGAGLQPALDEIGPAFTVQTGIPVQYNYAGGGALISQMNLTRKGDVFIPGSTMDFKMAKMQGLVGNSTLVAYHVPVIVVQKGNPKNITSLQDFARPGLKIALGDVKATAIGQAGAQMFAKLNITDAVNQNVVTRTPTINELTVIMNTGQADASILTIDQYNSTTMDEIAIPANINDVMITPIGATTFTTNATAAQEFVDFVSSDQGKAIFAKHGFPIYPDPAYASVTP